MTLLQFRRAVATLAILTGGCAAPPLDPAPAQPPRSSESPGSRAEPTPIRQQSPSPLLAPSPESRDGPRQGTEIKWIPVWADEFDGPNCPDPANWRHETGFHRNEELQWYQPDNAFCEGGMLVIEARRETVDNPNHVPGNRDWRSSRKTATYTSASLETKGLHSWQYGRIEFRARIDTRAGIWPAIWTLGENGRWPQRGEIDILEYYRGNLHSALHWGPRPWIIPVAEIDPRDPAWVRRFHVWRMDWSPERIEVYLDGKRTARFDIFAIRNSEGANPFQKPHYLKVNLAIGGAAGGNPSRTRFPARMEIDYIRVYRVQHGEG